jgi:FkbM family methyltransferase
MELFLRKIVFKLGPNTRKALKFFYDYYALFRYKKIFNKQIFFRGVWLQIGKDISILPQIKLGSYEKAEIDFLGNYSFPENCCFWDVGSNVGIYSVLFSKANPSWQIYSFEPNSNIHPIFIKNVKYNNCQNIKLIDLALSDSRGQMYLISDKNKAGGGYLSRNTKSSKLNNERVQTWTGDQLFFSGEFKAPNFIKIDVEGHELNVINGLKDVILSFKPIMAIEILLGNHESEYKAELFVSKLNDLMDIYHLSFLCQNQTIKQVFFLKKSDLNDSLQTLILVPNK